MSIDPCDREAFEGYTAALGALEKAFNMAGIPVLFRCLYSPVFGRTVLMKKGEALRSISIEGDSPAQAVKDIAAAVKL
ncbi:MAG: hypothetical protein LBK63_12055 [Treponema sp.]|jgi:hypothetical protein|nr:hypothetical protein [Treponema sp.]